MSNIPSQKDVNAIVNAIVENTLDANNILDAVFGSIETIATKAKSAAAKIQDVGSVREVVLSYKSMMNEIINTLITDNGEAGDLHELNRSIADPDNANAGVITKYKTIDMALQLPKLVNSIFSVFDRVSNGDFGVMSLLKFKINIWKLRPIIKSVFGDLLNMFASLKLDNEMETIMGSLVQQPDIIERNNNISDDGESKVDLSTTITKKGKYGIIDVFSKTFEIINGINTLQVPNFILLKIKLLKMRLALSMVLSDLIKWCEKNVTDEKKSQLNTLTETILGVPDSKGNYSGGLYGVIKALADIFKLTKKMKLNILTLLMVKISLFALGGIIDAIVKLKPKFDSIADEGIKESIESAANTFAKLTGIFKNLALVGLLSFAIIILSIPIVIALGAILLIVLAIKGIMSVLDKMKVDGKMFDPLLSITQSLKKIMLNLIILGLAAIPAAIAILIIAVFMVGMLIFCGLMWMVSLILEEISEEVTKSLKKVIWMLATLMLVGVAILLFALAAPVIAEALDGHIIPFLMLLGGSLFLMWILTKFAAKFASKATTSAVQLGINIMIMVGALLLCAGALVVLALLAEQMTMEKYGYITVMLLGIIALLTVMTGLGIALSWAVPFISMSIGSFGVVVGLIGVILLAAVSIVELSKLEINFGKYKDPTGDQVVGSGSGVIGNVGCIIDFAKFLRERVKEIGRARDFRKGKRAIRVVKRLVKNIVKIAESLESLQKIELDTQTILDRVKSVFDFVKDLETKISEWLHPSGEGSNVKEFIINSIKDAWRRARQDRDNEAAGEKLNRINALLKTLTDIATALESISNLKIDEELIKSNLNATFAFIKELDEHIRTKLDEDSSVVDDDNEENLGIVANITGSLKGVMDALNGIKQIKFGDKDYEIIETNMTMMFHGLWRIKEGLDKHQDWVEALADDYEDSMGSIGSMVAAVAKSVKDFADVNSNKLDKNIKLYERFISSVNTIDIEKVLKTSDMFRQMAEFSNSIKGDFDALADALGEKLLPVLEELKAVMSEIPQKLDEGFQNTSASIGAAGTGAANTAEGIQAQIKRENPNISPAELNAQTQQRMSQQASSNAKGVESKLAEIISILKTRSIKVDML